MSLYDSVTVYEIKQPDYTQYIACTASADINIAALAGSTKGAYVYANPNLHIGARHYPRLFFVLCAGEPLLPNIARTIGKELHFVDFTNLYAYRDVELIALAVLFSAGKLVNKLLHAPLSRMRVARVRLDAAEDKKKVTPEPEESGENSAIST